MTQNAPSLAHALIVCHQAYKRTGEQLASLDDRLSGAPSPYDEVRDFFHFVDNYVDDLDRAAETLAGRLGLPDRDVSRRLESYLNSAHGIRVTAADLLDQVMRRYDPRTRSLAVGKYAPNATRAFQMVFQIGALEAGAEMDQTLAAPISARRKRQRFATSACATISRVPCCCLMRRSARPPARCSMIWNFWRHVSAPVLNRSPVGFQPCNVPMPKGFRFSMPALTARATSPSATARRGCSLPVLGGLPPVERAWRL